MYDVVVVGASFAGLAVASQLKGRVLLMDHQPVGAGQTSACVTPLAVAQAWGCQEAILQVHHTFSIHTASRTFRYPLYYPFCAFGYARFCQTMALGLKVDFVQAVATGIEGDAVVTDRGSYPGRIIVDATGWRAVLARSRHPGFSAGAMNFGLETELPYRKEGLHFWVNNHYVKQGIAWGFPAGEVTRFGVGSYLGQTNLRDGLGRFLADRQLAMDRLHGGYFPYRTRPATLENRFLVGDAAGQCFPLTGEGIRPALYFGQALGQIIQRVLEGELSVAQAQARYRGFVRLHWPSYALLWVLQKVLPPLPNALLTPFGFLLRFPPILWLAMSIYREMAWF